ncbi:MAG: alpha/beta hydrolase [Minisyncoccia bacterium]
MEIIDSWTDSVGGRVRVLDISPENTKNASTQTVLLSCGWSESIDSVRTTALEFAKKGYRILAIDYADLDNLKDVPKIADIFPKSESIKSLALLKVLEVKNIKDVIALGHSEGAISLLGATSLSPNMFQKIILITPAGLVEKENFSRLAYRFLSSFIFDVLRSLLSRHPYTSFAYYRKVFFYFIKNPIQTIREAFGVASVDISQIICNMQKDDTFPAISIVYGSKDRLFPLELLDAAIEKNGLKNLHLFDGYHNDIHTKPASFIPFLENIIRG